MTKKVGPEQEEHLKTLEAASEKLQEARRAEEVVMKEVHALIRSGFQMNISGLRLSTASGLSLPRVYQVRDELKEAS